MNRPTAANSKPAEGVADWKAWLTLALLSIIWGSSFILIKRSLVAFDGVQVGCLRISISALAFLPVLLLHLRRIDWSRWRYFLLVGLTGSGIPGFMFAIAQTEISSATAGVLNSLTPLFTLFIGVLFFGALFSWSKLSGILVGLAGASLLILMNSQQDLGGNPWYALLVIIATLCYGTSGNTVGRYLRDVPSRLISAVSFSMVGIPVSIYLFSRTDFLHRMTNEPAAWASLGYVSILSLVGTVAATVIFFQLIQRTSPVFGSTVAYLIPIVASLWGVLDGEAIGWFHWVGLLLILSGIYLARR